LDAASLLLLLLAPTGVFLPKMKPAICNRQPQVCGHQQAVGGSRLHRHCVQVRCSRCTPTGAAAQDAAAGPTNTLAADHCSCTAPIHTPSAAQFPAPPPPPPSPPPTAPLTHLPEGVGGGLLHGPRHSHLRNQHGLIAAQLRDGLARQQAAGWVCWEGGQAGPGQRCWSSCCWLMNGCATCLIHHQGLVCLEGKLPSNIQVIQV
jgi:hypothetical protein